MSRAAIQSPDSTQTIDLRLRELLDDDLPIFFEQQLDPEANRMAAFTAKDPRDRVNFEAHWNKIRTTDGVTLRTILINERVAGNIASFVMFGDLCISYWIGKEYWGKGVATEALRLFLEVVTTRPICARVAYDNVGSSRVLEKCGFKIVAKEKGFANARGKEIEEFVYCLK